MENKQSFNYSNIIKSKEIAFAKNINKLVNFILENPDISKKNLIDFFLKHSITENRETLFRNIMKEYLIKKYGELSWLCSDIKAKKFEQQDEKELSRPYFKGMRLEPCEFLEMPQGEPTQKIREWEYFINEQNDLKKDKWVKCKENEKETTFREWNRHERKKDKRIIKEIEAIYSILFNKKKKYLQKNLFYKIRCEAIADHLEYNAKDYRKQLPKQITKVIEEAFPDKTMASCAEAEKKKEKSQNPKEFKRFERMLKIRQSKVLYIKFVKECKKKGQTKSQTAKAFGFGVYNSVKEFENGLKGHGIKWKDI